MMSRRKGFIDIALAGSEELLEKIPPQKSIVIENNRKIMIICAELLSAHIMMAPTASRICERGGERFGSFPAKQSIYNNYRPMLEIWRKAHIYIKHINTPANQGTADQFLSMNPGNFDSSAQFVIKLGQKLIDEKTKKINQLKSFIAANIHMETKEDGESDTVLLEQLSAWVARINSGHIGFEITENEILVSRRTGIGTKVMDMSLFRLLAKLVVDKNADNLAKNRLSVMELGF